MFTSGHYTAARAANRRSLVHSDVVMHRLAKDGSKSERDVMVFNMNKTKKTTDARQTGMMRHIDNALSCGPGNMSRLQVYRLVVRVSTSFSHPLSHI